MNNNVAMLRRSKYADSPISDVDAKLPTLARWVSLTGQRKTHFDWRTRRSFFHYPVFKALVAQVFDNQNIGDLILHNGKCTYLVLCVGWLPRLYGTVQSRHHACWTTLLKATIQ